MLYTCSAQIYFDFDQIGRYFIMTLLNYDQMCIIGSFVTICSSIHLPKVQVNIADWLRQNKERVEEKAMNCFWQFSRMGVLWSWYNLSLLRVIHWFESYLILKKVVSCCSQRQSLKLWPLYWSIWQQNIWCHREINNGT